MAEDFFNSQFSILTPLTFVMTRDSLNEFSLSSRCSKSSILLLLFL